MKTNLDPAVLQRLQETLRQRFPGLTAADLSFEPGREDDFVNRVGGRTGESANAVREVLRRAGIDFNTAAEEPEMVAAPPVQLVDAQARNAGIPDETSRSGSTGL